MPFLCLGVGVCCWFPKEFNWEQMMRLTGAPVRDLLAGCDAARDAATEWPSF